MESQLQNPESKNREPMINYQKMKKNPHDMYRLACFQAIYS